MVEAIRAKGVIYEITEVEDKVRGETLIKGFKK
jgi:hypothetical protein